MRRFAYVIAALGLLLAASAGVQAATFNIVIDDLTDTVGVTVNGIPPTLLPDSTSEFIHFTIPFSQADNFGGISISRDLLEFAEGPVSDRLLVTASTFVDFKFASDPAVLPPGLFPFNPIVENGDFQFLGADIFELDTFFYTVRSDAADTGGDARVPLPLTLVLLGLGMVGVTGWRSL